MRRCWKGLRDLTVDSKPHAPDGLTWKIGHYFFWVALDIRSGSQWQCEAQCFGGDVVCLVPSLYEAPCSSLKL